MEILKHNYLFKKNSFELKNDCLHFKSKGWVNSIEYDISYEDISDKVVYETKMQDLSKLTIVFGAIGMIVTISHSQKDVVGIWLGIIIFTLIIVILYSTRRHTASIMLYDNRVLNFNLKKGNPEETKEFINQLQKRIKEFLKTKYLQLIEIYLLNPN